MNLLSDFHCCGGCTEHTGDPSGTISISLEVGDKRGGKKTLESSGMRISTTIHSQHILQQRYSFETSLTIRNLKANPTSFGEHGTSAPYHNNCTTPNSRPQIGLHCFRGLVINYIMSLKCQTGTARWRTARLSGCRLAVPLPEYYVGYLTMVLVVHLDCI